MGEPAELPSLGGSLALSFVSLGLVCLLAYLALKWLARRGVGRSAGPLRVLARCPLEPRRSVYLIETAGRCFLVGVGEGPMALLAEVDRAAVAVVLSILKGALGTPQIPPAQVITGLALILTCYVMAPTGERMYRAIEPLLGRTTSADIVSSQTVDALTAAGDRAKEPLREFLLK